MKKSLIALAVLGAVAGVAQAQTNVTIYGTVDAGITKSTGTTTAINSGDNNKIGFKGSEDLGGGLKAIFQIEQRFDIDTGSTEGAGARPLWQGQSTVGLEGAFGQVKIGRALTAKQLVGGAFDPWGGVRARGAFSPDLADAGYFSSIKADGTLDAAGNRWSNGVFYSSPVMGGFQANVSVATKESITTGNAANLTVTPYSLSGTYNNGPIAGAVAYERNTVNDKFWSLAGSYNVGVANLMATYAQQKFADDNSKVKAWTLGARVVAGPGDVLIGYGQARADGVDEKAKKFAIGYEYKLSKRTYVYADAINYKNKPGATDDSVNTFDVGVHHNF